MSEDSTYATVDSGDGFEVSSNTETKEEIREALKAAKDPVDTDEAEPEEKKSPKARRSEAASELGKAGGKAAAAKRAEAKETAKVEEDKPEETPKKEQESAKEEPEEGEDDFDEKDLGRARKDPLARMRVATHREAEAKRQLAEEREKRARIEERLEAIERQVSPHLTEGMERARISDSLDASQDEDPWPSADNFTDVDELDKARSRWAARQEIKAYQEQESIRQREQREFESNRDKARRFSSLIDKTIGIDTQAVDPEARKASVDEFLAEIDPELRALNPSFIPGAPLDQGTALADELLASDNPAELLRYLSDHPKEKAQIMRAPDRLTISRAIGRITAMLDRQEAPEDRTEREPRASKAHPPIRPLSGSSGSSDEDDLEAMAKLPFDRYVARMNAKEGRR